MRKTEKTYRLSAKYRYPLCKQRVPSSDYLHFRRRAASGIWIVVESCRRCRSPEQ